MGIGLARDIVLALLMAVLYALALPPVGWWPLGWICLVPLMWAVRGRPLRQVLLLGAIAGWTYAVLTGWWVWVAAHHQFDTSSLVSTLFLLLIVGPACGVAPLIAAPVAEAAARSRP